MKARVGNGRGGGLEEGDVLSPALGDSSEGSAATTCRVPPAAEAQLVSTRHPSRGRLVLAVGP